MSGAILKQITGNQRTKLILIALFILVVLLMMPPSYQLLVKPRGKAFDWFPVWVGGRAILAGENPYGIETLHTIQQGVYGHIISLDKYQHGFPHPAHTAFVLLPFIVIPFSASVVLWVSLQIPLFMVTLLLGLDLLKWSVRPLVLFLLLIFMTLGFRYPINVYVLGQLAFFVLFCFVLSAWLFQKGHPRWAAVVLTCATIRPDLAFVAILLALFWVWRSLARNEFMITLLVSGLVFALLPTVFLGGFWPLIWINAIFSYGHNPNAIWPPELLPFVWMQGVLLVLMALWLARYVISAWRKPTFYNQAMLVSATALFEAIVVFQTGSYNLTFILVSALILLRFANSRWLQALIVPSLLMPWLYFTLEAVDERAHWLIFLLIPGQFILFQELLNYGKFIHSDSAPVRAKHLLSSADKSDTRH